MLSTNNDRGWREKPDNVAKVRIGMRQAECSAYDFASSVAKGYAWMPSLMNGGFKRSCWVCQQLIGLDFDNTETVLLGGRHVKRTLRPGDENYISLDGAISRLVEVRLNPLCAYRTYSSTGESERFRVVLVLSEPLEDPDVAEMAIGGLLNLFPQADQQCKDLARLFFGTDKGVLLFHGDLVTGGNDVRAILDLDAIHKNKDRRRDRDKPLITGSEFHDIDDMKAEFDLLKLIQDDVFEPGRQSGSYISFNKCPVCGHRDCFRYYPSTNSWCCFSSSNATGVKGGSFIDYLAATRKVPVSDILLALARDGPEAIGGIADTRPIGV